MQGEKRDIQTNKRGPIHIHGMEFKIVEFLAYGLKNWLDLRYQERNNQFLIASWFERWINFYGTRPCYCFS